VDAHYSPFRAEQRVVGLAVKRIAANNAVLAELPNVTGPRYGLGAIVDGGEDVVVICRFLRAAFIDELVDLGRGEACDR